MKVLFIQRTPCIRNWKYARALRGLGHEVYLGQMVNAFDSHWTLPVDCYREVFSLSSFTALCRIVPYFDIVHVHNEPDWWTCLALSAAKGTVTPVIHDCHDWIPGRQAVGLDYFANAVVANTLADAVVYVSEVQRRVVENRIGERMAKSVIVGNYPLREFIPAEPMKKIGGGRLNAVYAGTISERKNSHRFYVEEFEQLFRMADINIHVYAPNMTAEYQKLEKKFPGRIVMKGHCDYTKLIGVLSQYDIGLLPFQKDSENADHLNSGLPNKLFEYLAAGIPVACRAGLEQQEKFIAENNCGFVYSSPLDFASKVQYRMPEGFTIDRYKFAFEDEVAKVLMPVYEKLSAANKYTPCEPPREARLVLQSYHAECEFYGTEGYEAMLYGKGHDRDLVFENFLEQTLPEGEVVNGNQ